MRTPLLFLSALAFATTTTGQDSATPDSTGLPGDGFSLSRALELFRQAPNLEALEQALNSEDGKVNNLDLDGDGAVDYIRVVDHVDGNAHAIVLQVPMGRDEAQDVAVIQLERTGDATAMVQIRGAEDLYGPDVIVEPYAEKAGNMKGSGGPSAPDSPAYMHVWVNVWGWPCVDWIYGPSYVVWVSPWYWDYYPRWWRPWRPYAYHTYRGWHRHHHGWYRHVNTCRVQRAHAVYQPRATYSPRVRTSTQPRIQQLTTGHRDPVGTTRTQQDARPQRRSDAPRAVPTEPRRGDVRGTPAPQQPREIHPERRPDAPRTAPGEPRRNDMHKAPASQQPRRIGPPQRPDPPRTAPTPAPRNDVRKAPAPQQPREARPQQRPASPRTAPQQRTPSRQAPAPSRRSR